MIINETLLLIALKNLTDLVAQHEDLKHLFIGHYKPEVTNVFLAERLASSLETTSGSYKAHVHVNTHHFIYDIRRILANKDLLDCFIELWTPIINRLFEKTGQSLAAYRDLASSINVGHHIHNIPEGFLRDWLNKLYQIKKELTKTLENIDIVQTLPATDKQLAQIEKLYQFNPVPGHIVDRVES